MSRCGDVGLLRAWKGAWDLAHPRPDPSGGARALLQPPLWPLPSDRHQVTGCCYERPSLRAPCPVEAQPCGSSHTMWTGDRAPEQGWEGAAGPPQPVWGQESGRLAVQCLGSWPGAGTRGRGLCPGRVHEMLAPWGWEDGELPLAGAEHGGSTGGPDAAADKALRRYRQLNVVVRMVLT